MIVYIGFSKKTHKLHARIICKEYKHCAPVVIIKNQAILYQFVRPFHIIALPIKKRDLEILKHHGWKFVKYTIKNASRIELNNHAITCVQFTKNLCRIKNIRIQTPDNLLKYLTHQ